MGRRLAQINADRNILKQAMANAESRIAARIRNDPASATGCFLAGGVTQQARFFWQLS
jgi:hypothetical protein